MGARYKLQWKKSAAKEIQGLETAYRGRVIAAVEALTAQPLPDGVRKLQGTSHTFRIRVGDYRVVYSLENHERILTVLRVRHRRDVYS